MLKTTNDRYYLGNKFAIDVVAEPIKDNLLMDGIGLLFMGGEEKTPGAKENTPEEYSHKIHGIFKFKNKHNLELAQTALEILQRAMTDEMDEQNCEE